MQKHTDFDRSVYFTAGIISLLSLLICGYRLINYEDCSAVAFKLETTRPVAGRLLRFIDLSPNARRWEWDFGDSSGRSRGKSQLHVFKRPGNYTVRLVVNGQCESVQQLTVFPDLPVDSGAALYPKFSSPLTATVGEPVFFADNTPGSTKWEWSFGETLQTDDTTRAPRYIYRTPGSKTVSLAVNGNTKYKTTQSITVFGRPLESPARTTSPRKPYRYNEPAPEVSTAPLPPPITPVKEEKAPELGRIQLENWLLQIAEEKITPDVLLPYVCNNTGITVRANGKGTTLKGICGEIRGKKIQIRNLDMVRNEETGCITLIRIDYKRKKVLGIF